VRWLGIDFGERRVGVALGDPVSGLATPWGTLVRRSDQQLVVELARLAREQAVTGLVLGRPERPDGTPSPTAPRVSSFASKLAAAVDLPLTWVPEALTTVAAAERLRDAGVDLRRHPERLDAVAAQILLEEAFAAWRRALPADSTSTTPPGAAPSTSLDRGPAPSPAADRTPRRPSRRREGSG
jgi:putative Holliday junction resolvase